MISDTLAETVDQISVVRGLLGLAMTELVQNRQAAEPHSRERANLRAAASDIEDALVKVDRALLKVRRA